MNLLENLINLTFAATLSVTGLAFSNGAVVQLGSVTLGEGSDARTMAGTAEIEMNNANVAFINWDNFLQNNGLVVGYLKFDQGTPGGDCYGSGDCWAARWNQKPGGSSNEGYLSGWAKLEIGSNSPEMWVHFKAPTDPNNYNCDSNSIKKDNNYYVCNDSTGKLFGYAWSSGGGSNSVGDNPALGWLDFSQAGINFPAAPAPPPPVPAPLPENTNLNTNLNGNVNADTNTNGTGQNSLNQYCYIYLDSNAKNKTICANSGSANFQAVTSGLDIQAYHWDCSGENSPTATCPFSGYGQKMPQLNLTLTDGSFFSCQAESTVLLTDETKCSLKASSLNTNDNLNPLSIFKDDTVRADVTGQCIDGLNVNWTVKGLNRIPINNSSIKATPQTGAASGIIEASVTAKDGRLINCGKVNVTIKQKVNWGE